MEVAGFVEFKKKIVDNCSKVILGKEDAMEKIAVSF